ncbi:MAG: hypothetical protein INH11_16415 [Gemmatimonas sp.]|nr:hypothetical protein [Gemmatimonas sp.]
MLLLFAATILFSPSGYGHRLINAVVDARKREVVLAQEWSGLAFRARAQVDTTARVVIVSSVDCVYCRMLADSLAAWERVKVPLSFLVIEKTPHNSERSSVFAASMICNEGRKEYAKAYQSLMKPSPTTPDGRTSDVTDSITIASNSSPYTLSGCTRAASTEEQLRLDSELLRQLKVSATPTFINRHGQLLEGLTDRESILQFATR